MKKIAKIILIIVIISIICIFSLSYTINENNNYKDRIINRIKKHYQTDEITYANYQDSYYIFTTKDKIIVLDNEYNKELEEELKNIKENDGNYEIVYKSKKLLYEKTEIKKNKVIYTYYDIKTKEVVKETVMEK